MKTKNFDTFPLVMAIGTGVVVFATYWTGKFGGRVEAYSHCSKMLKDAAEEMGKIKTDKA